MISRVFKRTVFAAAVAAGILAGTAAHAATLDDVYCAVAQGTRVEAADAKSAVDAMRASAAAAGAARDEAARTKKSLEAEVAALEEAVSAAQERVRERRAKLEKERASVEAVLASIERHEGLLIESVMKTQIGRSEAFMDDAPVSKTDGVARLRRHWVRALGAVAGSAGVRTAEDAVIYDAAGAPSRGAVTLYGPFAAKAWDGAWLRYLPSERAWRRLADDPGIPTGVAALDPSFGRLLAGYAERHSAWAWMKPAGVIGIFIGLVAAAALLLGFLRWTALALEERRVRRQLEDMENPREDNSLGRMLAAAKESTDELLEAKLDAAIVAERPGFERGVATLAVLAGIPTLLGLLGTVSGMIETFTVMSEHGSAEPGLLAGGIAEALVTTELGLVSAIPILLLHCAVKTKRDALFSHLEEAASTRGRGLLRRLPQGRVSRGGAMNEALAGFWWFEDLSLLMDRGGHVLWAILALSTVLWMILLTGARRLKDAEKAWTAATAAPALEWATATAASRRRMMQAALVRVRRTAAAEAAWARVIVALLPLLGLLGTVTGMIESFETLSAAGGSDPGGLTGGISAALLTTLAGLVTALPGVFAVHRLERRTDRLADNVRARLRRFMRPSCCRS